MRIDMRYFIVIGAFYAPGVMMLGGALMLGYSVAEVREAVVVAGSMIGTIVSLCVAIVVFVAGDPIWWRFPRRDQGHE